MPLNDCIEKICKFINAPQKEQRKGMFRVTIVPFEDKCNINCGRRFAEILGKNPLFEVSYYNEAFPKGFLNLQGRNFFDFIDQGNRILEKEHSDVLVWGYEENGKIRLNFQTEAQYVIPNELSFSLLDSLFVPLSYFTDTNNFSPSLLLMIYGVITAAVKPVTNEQLKGKPKILNDIVRLLAEDTSPKDISREFMPFIMNMLGKIYLNDAKDSLRESDIEIIESLLSAALKNKQYMRLPIYYGCIYNNLGQLYETAFGKFKNIEYLKNSIKFYREGQKYLTRNYPFDYGIISYHLALLYFEFWKQTDDLQALRDAVSQLRDAEKVYTVTQFPQAWCHVEKLLGYYLTCLGSNTESNEIMQLAVDSFRNMQKIYTQTDTPQEWAEVQEEIGNVYYLLGKQNDDDNFMYEARNYFNSALEVYEKVKNKTAQENVRRRLDRIKNYIN